MVAKKRRSLDDQLAKQTAPPSESAPAITAPAKVRTSSQPGSRAGRKAISGFYEPEVAKQLKVLVAMEERTVQGMLGEALNLLFEKYGLDAIAESDK